MTRTRFTLIIALTAVIIANSDAVAQAFRSSWG